MSGRRTRWKQRRGPYRHREYGPRQAEELVEIDAVLREAPELLAAVARDIEEVLPEEQVMTAEQCLRAFIIRGMNDYDYATLEQKLADSRGYERFCGTDVLGQGARTRATLEAYLERISPATIEALHATLVKSRRESNHTSAADQVHKSR